MNPLSVIFGGCFLCQQLVNKFAIPGQTQLRQRTRQVYATTYPCQSARSKPSRKTIYGINYLQLIPGNHPAIYLPLLILILWSNTMSRSHNIVLDYKHSNREVPRRRRSAYKSPHAVFSTVDVVAVVVVPVKAPLHSQTD